MTKLIRLLITGGTVSTRFDASAGAAILDFRPENLLRDMKIKDVRLEVQQVMRKGSANIRPEDWAVLAKEVAMAVRSGAAGVVILHGTDTMHYTASALSFALRNLPIPVVLTGSMIPGGEPRGDARRNMRDALIVASKSDIAEVCIVFSKDPKGRNGVILRGNRARKLKSYAMDAFTSPNLAPLGYVACGKIIYTRVPRRKRSQGTMSILDSFDDNVGFFKLYPGLSSDWLEKSINGLSGLVIEGFGVGHISTEDGHLRIIQAFEKPAILCTQAFVQGVRLGMYNIDRKILAVANIIPARDMLPETALVKLMWCLGGKMEVPIIMKRDVAGEITEE